MEKFLLAYIGWTKGFHCDIFSYAHTCFDQSPLHYSLYLPSPFFYFHVFHYSIFTHSYKVLLLYPHRPLTLSSYPLSSCWPQPVFFLHSCHLIFRSRLCILISTYLNEVWSQILPAGEKVFLLTETDFTSIRFFHYAVCNLEVNNIPWNLQKPFLIKDNYKV
jgi:hypothetical protein